MIIMAERIREAIMSEFLRKDDITTSANHRVANTNRSTVIHTGLHLINILLESLTTSLYHFVLLYVENPIGAIIFFGDTLLWHLNWLIDIGYYVIISRMGKWNNSYRIF